MHLLHSEELKKKQTERKKNHQQRTLHSPFASKWLKTCRYTYFVLLLLLLLLFFSLGIVLLPVVCWIHIFYCWFSVFGRQQKNIHRSRETRFLCTSLSIVVRMNLYMQCNFPFVRSFYVMLLMFFFCDCRGCCCCCSTLKQVHIKYIDVLVANYLANYTWMFTISRYYNNIAFVSLYFGPFARYSIA